MLAPIVCLSLFAVSAWALVELHGAELPRAIWSLTESPRFKRQFGSDHTTQCIASCAQDLNNAIQSLAVGMEETAIGLFNRRLYDPDTFNSFCGRVDQWSFCSRACSSSQTKAVLIKAFKPFESLCGEDRETFESHQACYQKSDPQQKQVCDPKCGGQAEVKQEMSKFHSVAGDGMGGIFNRLCKMSSCQIHCRIPIIYAACKDKEAVFFIERWAQDTMKQALAPLAGRHLDIKCDDVINFNPDKFDFDEPGVKIFFAPHAKEDSYGKNLIRFYNLAPQTTRNNIVLIALCLVFAGFLL